MKNHQHDYHTHSTYSDGGEMEAMVKSATELGLDGIGFADHCLLSDPEKLERVNYAMDISQIQDRHSEIELLDEKYDIRVYDAVEIDYYPDDSENIREFVQEHEFEYTIGAVHVLAAVHFSNTAYFEGMDDRKKGEHVERYFEWQVDLIESEIFDIVAHLDLFERNEELRGLATTEQYERVAVALTNSSTVPEINGASIPGEHPVLPREEFFEILHREGISFVRGSDAHSPSGRKDLKTRNGRIDEFIREYDVELRTIGDLH